MNTENIYDAISGFNEKFVAAADDTDALRRSFWRQKKRRMQMIAAACGCVVVVIAVVAVNTGVRSRYTPAVIPSETWTADRPSTQPASSEATATAPGFVPSETGTPPIASDVQVPDTNRDPSAPSVPDERQNQPTQSPTASPAVSATADGAASAQESSFWKAYRYSLNGSAYASYLPGKVITPDRVGEKIGDATVTAGWEYADGTMPETVRLRCEIYVICDIDPETAICLKFLDKGEALTTDHYYVQINALADSSAVSDYIIPQTAANGEE